MSDLRELAEAATPGPWVAEEYDGSTGIGPGPFTMSRAPLGYFSEDDYENTAFIAAANPTAVLALLDRAEATEAELVVLREQLATAASLIQIAVWNQFQCAHLTNVIRVPPDEWCDEARAFLAVYQEKK